jgi:phage terminase small subunit
MAKFQTITLRSGEEISLTDKELLFCNYYLGECNKNGTQSVIKAGYSKKTAASIAAENLRKPHIQKYLQDKTAPLMEALGITQEWILKRLRDTAGTNLAYLTDDDWNLLPKSQIKKEHHAAVGAVEIDEKILMQEGQEGLVINRKVKYKLKPQEKSLLALAEMAGLIDKKGDPVININNTTNIFNQINNHIQEK